jgi:hypothetical protein
LEPTRAEEIMQWIAKELPGSEPAGEVTGGYLHVRVPKEIGWEPLVEFFKELKERKEEMGISQVAISLTTLEDVFLKVASEGSKENVEEEDQDKISGEFDDEDGVQLPGAEEEEEREEDKQEENTEAVAIDDDEVAEKYSTFSFNNQFKVTTRTRRNGKETNSLFLFV